MCEFSKILITRTRSVHMEFTTVVLCGLRTCFQRHFVIVSRSFTRGTGGAYFPGEKRIQTTKTSFLKKNVFLHPLTAQNCVPKTCMPALHLSGERQEGLPCNLGKGQKKRSLRNSFEIIFAGFSFIFLHAQKNGKIGTITAHQSKVNARSRSRHLLASWRRGQRGPGTRAAPGHHVRCPGFCRRERWGGARRQKGAVRRGGTAQTSWAKDQKRGSRAGNRGQGSQHSQHGVNARPGGWEHSCPLAMRSK